MSEIGSLSASNTALQAGMGINAVKMAAKADQAVADMSAENAKAVAAEQTAAAARGGISMHV